MHQYLVVITHRGDADYAFIRTWPKCDASFLLPQWSVHQRRGKENNFCKTFWFFGTGSLGFSSDGFNCGRLCLFCGMCLAGSNCRRGGVNKSRSINSSEFMCRPTKNPQHQENVRFPTPPPPPPKMYIRSLVSKRKKKKLIEKIMMQLLSTPMPSMHHSRVT